MEPTDGLDECRLCMNWSNAPIVDASFLRQIQMYEYPIGDVSEEEAPPEGAGVSVCYLCLDGLEILDTEVVIW